MDGVTKTAAQIFFQNSLHEVIRNLRSTPAGKEEEVIEQYIRQTKSEVGSTVQSVKVGAIQKAAYFHMIGYDSSYANFNVVEVMADPYFGNKRAAYMAAGILFNENTDVVPLMTALLKRDLCSSNQYESGLALYCIASICNTDLAKDLVVDVVNLLNHPRTYVRKKAVLSLYKIFLQYPEALRLTYTTLKEKLEDSSENCDSDTAVRGAVVCIFCELARRNPANFLSLAVPFFSLLSNIHNNWTLIKVIKVFGYFVPLEPRLGKKLAEPLANLIETTSAKSVQYECLLAVANGMTKVTSLTKLAAEKLVTFVEDPDQNLKFLGLQALKKLAFHNAKFMQNSRNAVIKCLDDKDIAIRSEALSILTFLVTPDTIIQIVDLVLDRCCHDSSDEEWSNMVVATVVEMCRSEDYAGIEDFEWYLGVLLDLALIPMSCFQHGHLIENEIVSIVLRVNGIRPFAVESLCEILSSKQLVSCDERISNQSKVLKAAAFVCGEYPHWLHNKLSTVKILLSDSISLLSSDVQCACLLAVGKIVGFCVRPCKRHVERYNGEEGDTPEDDSTELVVGYLKSPEGSSLLEKFRQSVFADVQEKANLVYYTIQDIEDHDVSLFENELLTVVVGSQKALEVPSSLSLHTPFCEDIDKLLDVSDSGEEDLTSSDESNYDLEYKIEQEMLREVKRREEVDPFYLKENAAADTGLPTKNEEFSSTPKGRFYRKEKSSSRKNQMIKRDLLRPENFQAQEKKEGRYPMSSEEDEAAIKLRGIDVTAGYIHDQASKEPSHYGRSRKAAGKSITPALTTVSKPFKTLYESKRFSLRAYQESCKCKKQGFFLNYIIEVANKGRNSIENVYFSSSTEEGGEVISFLESDGKTPSSTFLIGERINPGHCERQEFVLLLSKIPDSLMEPFRVSVSYTLDGVSKEENIELTLSCINLFKADEPPPVSSEFLDIVEKTLVDTATLSAFCACSSKQISDSMEKIQNCLHLQPVDVFKDCVTLSGRLHYRKSELSSSYVVVLLQETCEEDNHGVIIAVKSVYNSISESLIYEISSILGGTSD